MTVQKVHHATAGFADMPTPLVRVSLAHEYTWTNRGKGLGGVMNSRPAKANEDHLHGILNWNDFWGLTFSTIGATA